MTSRSCSCSESGGANTIVDVTGTAQTGGTIAAPRSAADRQRGEDDAGPLLRLHAVKTLARKPAVEPASPKRRERLFHRAPDKHRDHRLAVVGARMEVGVQVGDVARRRCAPPPRSRRPPSFRPAPSRHRGSASRASSRRSARCAPTESRRPSHRAPRRHADHGVVRRALMQLGIARRLHRRELHADDHLRRPRDPR